MEFRNMLLHSKIAKRLLLWYLIAVLAPFGLFYLTASIFSVAPLVDSIWQFLLVISLSLGIGLMLALQQIRQLITPINQLREATRNIANQKFDTELTIRSNDEFEELATTLNQMRRRLGKQFNALETVAQIDRLILSTLNIDNIVEIILSRMVNVVPCDSVSVLITKPGQEQFASLYYRKKYLSTDTSRQEVNLSEDDLKLIQSHPDSLPIENNGFSPKFLTPLKHAHMNFLLLPIFLEKRLASVLILGFKNSFNLTTDDLLQARDLAHRIAVALSNAAWEDKLYHRAHYDLLTDLPNRLLFQDRLQTALQRAQRDKTIVALMFLDLDRFKFINDSLGHDAGDKYLHEIAKRLKASTRSIDTVARLGGDEFTIIFPDLNDGEETLTNISQVAAKILRATSHPIIIDGQEIIPSLSIGISLYPRDASDMSNLLRHADSAMYYAKSKGQANFQFYSDEQERDQYELTLLAGEESTIHSPLPLRERVRVRGIK